VSTLLYQMKDHSSHIFLHEELLVGGDPLLPEILGQTDPVRAKTPNYQSIFARSSTAVTLSGKKFNYN